jgi:hypothetical protein
LPRGLKWFILLLLSLTYVFIFIQFVTMMILHCLIFTDFWYFWNELLLRIRNLWIYNSSEIYFWFICFLLRFLIWFFFFIIKYLHFKILINFMILAASWRQFILEILKVQLIIIRSNWSFLETIIVFSRLLLIIFILMIFIFTCHKRRTVNDFILQLSLSFHHFFRSLWTLRISPWLIIFIIFILIWLINESENLSKTIWTERCHIIEWIIIRSIFSILNCKIKSRVCWFHWYCTHFMLISQKCLLGIFQVFKDTDSWCSCIIEIWFVNFIQVGVWCGFELTYIYSLFVFIILRSGY